MSSEREFRVSDQERQVAADRLRAAHDEGRLNLDEYDRRVADAYSSVTYADLDKLFVDLPGAAGHDVAHVQAPLPAAQALRGRWVPAQPPVVDVMPTPLKVLWTIWACVVTVNLTVWLLVSLGNGAPDYFWPIWLAVPGAALLVVTAATAVGRSGRSGTKDR
jgi:hypothetical protein